jgi:hypothetical protein
VKNTVIGVVTLKGILFALFRNLFRLLTINGHDVNKTVAEIIFILKYNQSNVLKSLFGSGCEEKRWIELAKVLVR